MKLLDMPDDIKVHLDYGDKRLPATAGILQPVVFYDGSAYCCLLGPNPQQSIYGRGETPYEALENWDRDLQRRLTDHPGRDELTRFVMEQLGHDNH